MAEWRRSALLGLAALATAACAAGPAARGTRSAPAAPPRVDDGGGRLAHRSALRQALDRAIAEPAERERLELFVECRRDSQMQSARMFGSGVGIWNEERQFQIDQDQLAALVRKLHEADFAGLEEVYGHPTPGPEPPGDGAAMATMVTCRIHLALGGHEKQVVQMGKGEQSAVLAKLADDLLAIGAAAARDGRIAASLRDGLEKIARGELAPETWLVLLHRKPDEQAGREGRTGFLLRILAGQATARAFDPASGYRDQVSLALNDEEVRGLARALAGGDPGAWPLNLHARDYTDLTLQVLNHSRSVQAREFAGGPRPAAASHQQAFNEAVAILSRLAERVLDQGRPAAAHR